MGEQEKAQALTDRLMSAINTSPSVTYHDSAIQEAALYALSGQMEAVIADDPKYQSILRAVNDRLSEQKANLARWKASGELPPLRGVVADP